MGIRSLVLVLMLGAGLVTPAHAVAPLKIEAAALLGYDNNAHLNAERKDDGFGQETLSVSYRNPVSDFAKLRLSYDLVNVNYFSAHDEDILWQQVDAGLDFNVGPATTLEADYYFSYFYFHGDDLASSLKHAGRAGLRHKFSKRVSAGAGFGVSTKGYEDRKLREAEGFLSDDERSDFRYTADSDLRIRVSDAVSLRTGFIYYRNDSDDQFHDFYDYDSYKAFVKAVLELCPKLSASFKFSYERRDYDSRPIFDDPAEIEEADIYTGSGGLFYELTKNMAIGVVYTYRQKDSNEPSRQYSSSITTLGLYYSF